MTKNDLLEKMIDAAGGYVKGKLTSKQCSDDMHIAINEYTEQLKTPDINEKKKLLLAYEEWGCTDKWWIEQGKEDATRQVDGFLNKS